jgi:quercetin dioxygenase-like cupin family protein
MPSEAVVFQDLLKAVPEIAADSVISRSLYKDERLDVTLFGFAPGQELSEHSAPYRAIIHVLQGQAHITLGQRAIEAQAGAWINMPPHLPHSLKASTRFVMLLTIVK